MSEEHPSTVTIDFLKSEQFRVVHADGAFGGINPRLNGLFLTFYSERLPIPNTLVFEVENDGRVGSEVKAQRVSKPGIVREAEVGISMDLEVARSLLLWLQDKIVELEKAKTDFANKQAGRITN